MVPSEDVRVVASIPVFRPPADFVDRVRGLRDQVDAIVIVDDGSGALPLELGDDDAIVQISLPENVGIAAALNVGVDRAIDLGATHVLTLDQDSTVPPGYVAELLSVLVARGSAGDRVAAAVPASAGGAGVLREGSGAVAPFDPIQSGQLIPVDVIRLVGRFDESLFIDAVDSDFWFRACESGLDFVVAENAHIEHGLGELRPIMVFGRQLVWAGRPRHVLYHSPFRTYYMVRNSWLMHVRYSRQHRRRVLKRDAKMFEMVAGCILLAEDRRAQLRAAWAGFRDARAGTTGKIPARVMATLSSRRAGTAKR